MQYKDKQEKETLKPISFLNNEDLKNLDNYTYHAGVYTPLDNFMSPIYGKMVYMLPDWLAPNAVTLVGLAVNILAFVFIMIYDPYLNGTAPSWVYLYAAFANTFYQVFDCLDGKQARRLGASSPLGQIFDHGCDSFNLNCIIITLMSASGLGVTPISSTLFLVCCFSFALAQLLEYYTGVLLCGSYYFGVSEALVGTSIIYIIAGIWGTSYIHRPISILLPFIKYNLSIIDFVLILAIAAISLTSIVSFIQPLFTGATVDPKERGNKNLTLIDYLERPLPLILMTGCSIYIFNQQIFSEYPIYFLLLSGLTFSFFSTRCNISHLTCKPLTWRFTGVIPLAIYTICSLLNYDNKYILFGCLGFISALYLNFVISCIDQIKHHLHIRCLHLTSTSKTN